jgi:hypothetical protein
MEPEDRGYEAVASKGPLTKYVAETDDGRKVVYHTPERSVRVNETTRTPNVVEASPEFFWRETISDGLLHRNDRTESVEEAHQMAQARIESLLS